MLDAMSEECADCEHSVAFFSGPCSIGLSYTGARLGKSDTSISIAEHEQAYSLSEVGWDRWSVRPHEQNNFCSVRWNRPGPLSKLFEASRTKEYRRLLVCVGDRAVAHISTIVFRKSAPPQWERLDALVSAMLPAFQFASLPELERMKPANDVLAYLSAHGQLLAVADQSADKSVVQQVASQLQRSPGELQSSLIERHRLELRPQAQLAGGQVVELRRIAGRPFHLSERDQELARWLERGLNNREIAAMLGANPTTVKKALERLYQRTGAAGRTELVHLLRQDA